jgi:hypothetical protein
MHPFSDKGIRMFPCLDQSTFQSLLILLSF